MSYQQPYQPQPNYPPGFQGQGAQQGGYYQYQQGQGSYPYQQAPYQSGMNPNVNVEGGLPKRDVGFNDITVRAAFVRKVFSLVTFMLTVVTAMTAIPFIYDPMMNFLNVKHGNPTALVLYLASYVIFLIVYIALICCESVRRRFPSNIICTGILTLAMGYMVMMNAARYTLDSVLLCLIMTTISCGGIILFSMQTKYDLTKCMGFLCIATLIMMVFAIVTIVYTVLLGLSILNMVYAGLAVLLLMGYLAVDIQMIMGGRKYEISPEEHIFAAIMIFLDIVLIFLYLLQIFGKKD